MYAARSLVAVCVHAWKKLYIIIFTKLKFVQKLFDKKLLKNKELLENDYIIPSNQVI